MAAPPPIALTIAGSDSGGGAGLQADLRTFQRFGVYGTSAVTAVTAQNTTGVRRWDAVAPSLVRAQIDAVVDDLRPVALKTGMLGTVETVAVVAQAIAAHHLTRYILDPVLIATSGDALAGTDVVREIRQRLLPLAELVTPNLDEAGALLGSRIDDLATMRDAARALVSAGTAGAALVKGGHLGGDTVVDVLYDGDWTEFRHRRVPGGPFHGTGCTLSAAITAHRARGMALRDAVEHAIAWVQRALAGAPAVGAGARPLDHGT